MLRERVRCLSFGREGRGRRRDKEEGEEREEKGKGKGRGEGRRRSLAKGVSFRCSLLQKSILIALGRESLC